MPKNNTKPTVATTHVRATFSEIVVAAEWLAATRAGECTSAQHEAIAHTLLERLLICFAIDHNLRSKSLTAIYKQAAGAHRQTRTLPKSRRTV